MEVAPSDEKTLTAHGREQQQKRALPVGVRVSGDHLQQTLFVQVSVHRAAVLHIDTEQGQFKVEVFAHATQGPPAPPNDHQVGLVLKQGADMVSQPFDGVFFAHAFHLLLGALHEPWRGRRPRLTVHAHLPLSLGVDRFVKIHDLGDGRAKVAECEGQRHLCRGFGRGGEAARVHFDAARNTDESNGLRLRSCGFQGVHDVAGRSVASGVENGFNTGLDELAHQPRRVLRCRAGGSRSHGGQCNMTLVSEARHPGPTHTALPSHEAQLNPRSIERRRSEVGKVDEALIHARAGTVFSPGRSGFCCTTIAALEPQFPTETGVRIDHQADAHADAWRHSLK